MTTVVDTKDVAVDHAHAGAPPCAMVIFGGSGDLTKRKLIPALYNLATSHLLRSGRRTIALISGSPAHYSLEQRARGYRRALFEAQVQADPDLEVIAPQLGDGEAGVIEAMHQLLGRRKRPDAVVCFNDSAALVAMRQCLNEGLRIPEDIAVVGFDDIGGASVAHPPLSTVRVDKESLGVKGVALLLGTSADEPQELTLPVELVVRDSTSSND